jgi:protein-tyrosine phosphatase
MNGFTDIHTHFVYGVDDGAKDAQVMRAMLDEAHRQGVSRIIATSHAELGMRPFDHETYQAHLEEGRQYCGEKGYEMELIPGAELLYTPAMDAYIRDRRLITLGDSPFALVEFVPDVHPDEIQWMLEQMQDNGYRTVLAHIERYRCMKGNLPYKLLEKFDVKFQVNCGTVLANNGLLADHRINKWFRDGIISFVATDMHNCDSRPPRMAPAWEALRKRFDEDTADYLTHAYAFNG